MTAEREPLVVRGAVVLAAEALLAVAVTLGWWPLSEGQQASVAAAIGAIGTAVVVVWSRGKVTPVADPRDNDGNRLR